MPLIVDKKVREHIQLGIWQMNEPIPKLRENVRLTHDEEEVLAGFKSERRQMEWLTARKLVQHYIGAETQIGYFESGKPHLKGPNPHISISHSGNLTALLFNKNAATGIDIQRVSDKVLRIKHKFVNDEEWKYVPESDVEMLHIIWGAKEALYKIHGDNRVFFKEHLNILPFKNEGSGLLEAELSYPGIECHYQLRFEKIEDYIMVYITD
jgi:4'-phosphopantetheinyl transferase